jgi:hypothetical protein
MIPAHDHSPPQFCTKFIRPDAQKVYPVLIVIGFWGIIMTLVIVVYVQLVAKLRTPEWPFGTSSRFYNGSTV